MTMTKKFASLELDILASTVPDALILPFRKEILALCKAFDQSGQTGGSAPYTATALSKAIKKLCLHEPICDITGHDAEWEDISKYIGQTLWQNKRCFSLFKDSKGECSYSNAIVWKEKDFTFTGRVYIDDKKFESIYSSQNVKFPFKPKTFYIDVEQVPISEEEAKRRNLHYTENNLGECYYSIIKNPKQLEAVFKYYLPK